MKNYICKHTDSKRGFALVLAVLTIVILLLLGMGLLTITYGVRLRAIKFKNQTDAMLAAEAGYERAIFWMNQSKSITSDLASNKAGCTGTLNFDNSSCNYVISFNNPWYIGGKPVFKITSTGICGAERRVVDVAVIEAVTGWDIGMCRIPTGTSSTTGVYFADGEIVDLPVHINKYSDNPDVRDIWIDGSPQFNRPVGIGESRKTGNTDKYSDVMGLFDGGISFDQPDSRITDQDTVTQKLNQFGNSTKAAYKFAPTANANIPSVAAGHLWPAVQIEFFKQGGTGMVRITNNCTVVGYQRSASRTHDFMLVDGSSDTFTPYDIYAYHYAPQNDPTMVKTAPVTDTYVQQTFSPGVQSDPGGQIYVQGNVIIGSSGGSGGTTNYKNAQNQLVVGDGSANGGKITIVATGNIWIGDSIVVDGAHTTDTSGVPVSTNPNALGLIAGGVVKVIDPGMSGWNYNNGSSSNGYPQWPSDNTVPDKVIAGLKHKYAPVANSDGSAPTYNRVLPDSTVIEAAVTCGGGGWGAENVVMAGTNYGGRRGYGGSQDNLILRGTICEAFRGIVGVINTDGYIKHYYLDSRLLAGVLPGNIWFSGRFIPAPAGWHDYRQ